MNTLDRIKALAKKQGWSLQKVAEKAGIGINSIYRWNAKTPSTQSLDKVAKVLGVSADYLLGNTSKKQTADLDDDDVIFTYQGRPLSDEDKALIKRLMNGKD